MTGSPLRAHTTMSQGWSAKASGGIASSAARNRTSSIEASGSVQMPTASSSRSACTVSAAASSKTGAAASAAGPPMTIASPPFSITAIAKSGESSWAACAPSSSHNTATDGRSVKAPGAGGEIEGGDGGQEDPLFFVIGEAGERHGQGTGRRA